EQAFQRTLKLQQDIQTLAAPELLRLTVPTPRAVVTDSGTYVYQSSPTEDRLRHQIVKQMLDDLGERMYDPEVGKQSSSDYVIDWFRPHPLERQQLQIASHSPTVIRVGGARPPPDDEESIGHAFLTALDTMVAFVPVIGTIVGATELAVGKNLAGDDL